MTVIVFKISPELVIAGVLLLVSGLLLVVYYLLLKHSLVPGYGRGVLELQGNLVQYIDLKYLPGHLYKPNWDPEGILSTLPALSSGIFGVIARIVLKQKNWILKMLIFLSGGVVLLFFAKWVNTFFPYNKNLWSSSFVLLTTGAGILLLAFLYLITDVLKSGRLLTPFKFIGSSAIFVYFISEIIRRSLWLIPVHDLLTDKTILLKFWLCQRLVTPWAHGLDSFYFSVMCVIVWMVIMGSLYFRKIYIRL